VFPMQLGEGAGVRSSGVSHPSKGSTAWCLDAHRIFSHLIES
jgi:hypothetical protein